MAAALSPDPSAPPCSALAPDAAPLPLDTPWPPTRGPRRGGAQGRASSRFPAPALPDRVRVVAYALTLDVVVAARAEAAAATPAGEPVAGPQLQGPVRA